VSGEPRLIATASQTVGPFFSFGLTTNLALGIVAPPEAAGERIHLRIRLVDGAGSPVPDAVIEIWHAVESGECLFGRLGTDADGVCTFETVYPAAGPVNTREAAHVNLCVFMRGLLRHLYTRLYFEGDAAIETDPVLEAVPPARRGTLIARRDAKGASTWTFDLHLQGDRETVYFDL